VLFTSSRTESAASRLVRPDWVLYWIYAGRLALALAVFGSALFLVDVLAGAPGGAGLARETRLLAIAGLALAGLGTPLAYWYSHLRKRQPDLNFLYAQALLDIAIVTIVVHITGGSGSVFPPLFYVALASSYALIVPMRSALLIALTTGGAYLVDISVAYPEQLGAGVMLQVVIFTGVASATSLIGGRLRQQQARVRRLEGELHRLRLDTTDVLRTVDSGVLTFDPMGRLAYMNPAAEELLGVDAAEWLGRDLLHDMGSWAPELARAIRDSLEAGRGHRNREVAVRRGLEEPFPVSASTALLQGGEGPPSVTVALQDLRPLRRIEELRRRASRLEAVAELSASLAHEIRNPLASIRSAVEQLGVSAGELGDEDDRALTRLVMRESDRLNALLGEFSDFARVDVAEREPLELEKVLRDAVETVRQHPDTPGEAEIAVRVGDGLERDVWGDPELLHRTLLNLALNAVQVTAPHRPPRIEIVVDEMSPTEAPPAVSLGAPVRIRVIDNGPGISSDEIDRIFDPFYSTREGGSGMGLSIAHRAVEAHGGVLMVTSRPGEGSTFAVILPRRAEERRSAEDGRPDGSRAEGGAADGSGVEARRTEVGT